MAGLAGLVILGGIVIGIIAVVRKRLDGADGSGDSFEEIFEGGNSINFNPGANTIVIASKFRSNQPEEKTRRDIQRMVLGDSETDGEMTEVFIDAGDRQIAAYESRSKNYGQVNLNYFIFMDAGEIVYVTGPEKGFDHALKTSLARNIAAGHPANEMLYTHVEPPSRDPSDPCGFTVLPDRFEIQAVGIRRGSVDLEGVAIDPEVDEASEQTVAVGKTEAPVVLLLMSGRPTAWKLMTTPDAEIAGVIASGRTVQRVIGLADNIPLKEIDPHDRNGCEPFYATEDDGSEFDQFEDRVWQVFAQGVRHMHSKHGGEHFRIGEFTAEPVMRGERELADVIVSASEHLLPGKLGLAQLADQGVLRHAEPSDLSALADGQGDTSTLDLEALRRNTQMAFRMQRAFVVTAKTDLPPGMYGANSAVFLVANDVPDPGGDRGHNTLIYADGRCTGPACP